MPVWTSDALDPLVTVHTGSLESLGAPLLTFDSPFRSGASATLTANRAYLVPFRLEKTVLAKQLFVWNGTVASGNIDVAIYDRTLTKLTSAANVAQAGTSALQAFDITDVLLGPGRFYFAVVLDNATGTLIRQLPSIPLERAMGMLHHATAYPLPARLTTPIVVNLAIVPNIGFSTRVVL